MSISWFTLLYLLTHPSALWMSTCCLHDTHLSLQPILTHPVHPSLLPMQNQLSLLSRSYITDSLLIYTTNAPSWSTTLPTHPPLSILQWGVSSRYCQGVIWIWGGSIGWLGSEPLYPNTFNHQPCPGEKRNSYVDNDNFEHSLQILTDTSSPYILTYPCRQ